MKKWPIPIKPPVRVNPRILGGTPVIEGTRIPAEMVVGLIERGYSLDLIHREYPSLTKARLMAFVGLLREDVHAQAQSL